MRIKKQILIEWTYHSENLTSQPPAAYPLPKRRMEVSYLGDRLAEYFRLSSETGISKRNPPHERPDPIRDRNSQSTFQLGPVQFPPFLRRQF